MRGQMLATTPWLPRPFATRSSRMVGYALPRTCVVGVVESQSGGPSAFTAVPVQSHEIVVSVQSFGWSRSKTHANWRSTAAFDCSVFHSRPLIGSALFAD